MGRHTTKLGDDSRAQTRPPLPYPVNDGRIAPPVKAVLERRAHRRKSRLAALSAASMLAIGGAAGMSMAMADEPEAAKDGEIVFSGNCGTLNLVSATSKPDSEELTVAEGSKVRLSNELGADATLHVGSETYEIESGSTQMFVMNQSAEVAMVPDCHGLFADYDSAQVTVVAEQADRDDSTDESDSATGQLPSQGSDGSGSDPAPAEPPASDDDQSGQSGLGLRGEGSDRSGEREPAGEEAPADEGEDTEEDEVNSFGSTGDDFGSDGAEPAPAAEEVAAVDPKAVTDGASGLLALLAIVCLVGVSAAVMRTILKQRATA